MLDLRILDSFQPAFDRVHTLGEMADILGQFLDGRRKAGDDGRQGEDLVAQEHAPQLGAPIWMLFEKADEVRKVLDSEWHVFMRYRLSCAS